jgi:hypothetical protein
MNDKKVGITVSAPDAATALSHIREAEEMGVAAV